MNMEQLKQLKVGESDTIQTGIQVIERSGKEICLVIGEDGRLKGIVTDSDVRRGLLRGLHLDDPIHKVLNPNFIYAWEEEDRASVQLRMKRDYIRQMPVLNESREVVDMLFLNDILTNHQATRSTPVVIMAGGLGNRLRPLTNHIPKPMLTVGGKPLLEIIINQLYANGFSNIYLSVNYLKEVIQSYFQDGSRFHVDIKYVEETKRMGTAGAVSFIAKKLNEPFLVLNGDILTKVNHASMLDFHEKTESSLSMATIIHRTQIPYGVVKLNDHQIERIEEKPQIAHFVNAGLYTLSPDVLSYIPHDEFFDMPDLVSALLNDQRRVSSFPIHEYWMDIGQIHDYDRANREFTEHFAD